MGEFWSRVLQTVTAALILLGLKGVGYWLKHVYTTKPERIQKWLETTLLVLAIADELIAPTFVVSLAYMIRPSRGLTYAWIPWAVAFVIVATRCVNLSNESETERGYKELQKRISEAGPDEIPELQRRLMVVDGLRRPLEGRFFEVRVALIAAAVWAAMFLALR